NLDRAARLASGDIMLMLSSDDLVYRGALACYDALLQEVDSERVAISATSDLIDEEGRIIGELGPDRLVWGHASVDRRLSAAVGRRVLSLPASQVLRRSLRTMRNPMSFLATA